MACVDDAPDDEHESVDWGHLRSASVFASLLEFVPWETLSNIVIVAPHVTFFVHRQWNIRHRDVPRSPRLYPSLRSIDNSPALLRYASTWPYKAFEWPDTSSTDPRKLLSAYADYLERCPPKHVIVWNKSITEEAAHRDMLGLLQWARENGCPWNESTCLWPEYYRNIRIHEWTHRGEWETWPCANDKSIFHICKWARLHRTDAIPKCYNRLYPYCN
jgi:hypothetical protein